MLVIGYGNPGRGDDGLGPAFTARLARRNLPEIEIATDYQLTVDDALSVANAEQVVFVDASMGGAAPFHFAKVTPGTVENLSSHSLRPETVLALAATLYGSAPKAFVLGIAGHAFGEVQEGLSAEAQRNLDAAEAFFVDWLLSAQTHLPGGLHAAGAAHA